MTIAPRPRRRSRPTLAKRLRRFWILGVVLVSLVGWGGFALANSPAFRLHELTVTGLSHVTRDDVLARAAINPHANVWLLDRTGIERRIEALPYVGVAHVHRRPLGNIWIDVTERTADGCVRSRGGEDITVDRDDRVLELGCAAAPPALAYELRSAVGGPAGRYARNTELAALQRDARALAATGDRFQVLRHDSYGGLEADLQGGVWVRFGDERDLERKLRLIGPILTGLGRREIDVRAVDLRAPTTPVVEYLVPTPLPKPTLERTQYTQGTRDLHHNM